MYSPKKLDPIFELPINSLGENILVYEGENSTLDYQIVTTLGLSFLISPDRRRGGGGWKEEGLAEATAAV